MAERQPPTPAWREGKFGSLSDTLGSTRLTTIVPSRLKKKGYIPTWPARAVVVGVAGVPSDANTPPGTTLAVNTDTDNLYRRDPVDGWRSVNGEV